MDLLRKYFRLTQSPNGRADLIAEVMDAPRTRAVDNRRWLVTFGKDYLPDVHAYFDALSAQRSHIITQVRRYGGFEAEVDGVLYRTGYYLEEDCLYVCWRPLDASRQGESDIAFAKASSPFECVLFTILMEEIAPFRDWHYLYPI